MFYQNDSDIYLQISLINLLLFSFHNQVEKLPSDQEDHSLLATRVYCSSLDIFPLGRNSVWHLRI